MKSMYFASVAGAALFAFAGAASAQSVSDAQFNNVNVRAQLNATISEVTSSVSTTAAAVGNVATIEGGPHGVDSTQSLLGDANAQLNATVRDAAGKVSATSAAVGNVASITSTGAAINNSQYVKFDPQATLNMTASKIGGLSATVAAVGNVATLGGDFGVANSVQTNAAGVLATGAIDVRDVTGSVNATAAAVGNVLSVTKGF